VAGFFEFSFAFVAAAFRPASFLVPNEGAKMGGKNPYIEETKFTPATKKYKITFIKDGQPIEVDPDKVPYGHDGLPGSILDISQGFHKGLDHACGGVCACSTCHVIVHEGLESCNEATDAELDQLDEAPGVTPNSRLGCQCVPDGTKDIVVEIPDWNKNYAKEAEH
jgi:2Fe-2S ferredoxin